MSASLVSIASLSILGGGRGMFPTSSIGRSPSPLLGSTFLSSSSISFRSSFSGLSLGISFDGQSKAAPMRRRGLEINAAKKYQLCQTKRNRSRKSLARTHGFRRRMRTTGGRAILQRRRAKGRKLLCTKSHNHTGKGT
ncbi:50S ribosomal protein L34, chloroplastic [Zostera marina]|uniref:50S ribosomal protein L34, chloroplastic n=1 Tax=Zostera marina TaxID=29655 RepID=A0A0K9PSD7_ZOSMR|nr:50S ribosomal protein L34, chloroplastic [Zostera marina]